MQMHYISQNVSLGCEKHRDWWFLTIILLRTETGSKMDEVIFELKELESIDFN
jgi:hypothetical protein